MCSNDVGGKTSLAMNGDRRVNPKGERVPVGDGWPDALANVGSVDCCLDGINGLVCGVNIDAGASLHVFDGGRAAIGALTTLWLAGFRGQLLIGPGELGSGSASAVGTVPILIVPEDVPTAALP